MSRMIERRFTRGAEIRTKDDGHIEGHAAVFNQEYVLWDSPSYRVVEKIKPGTFQRSIKEKQDVRALFNHDPNHLLGRTAAETLSISEDKDGLYFDCKPPATQLGRDLAVLISRRDITGCSFSFIATKEVVTEEKHGDQIVRTREIQDCDVFDVGLVTYPAYTGTDVNARSIELRSLMFPGGIPDSVAGLVPELRADHDNVEPECGCRCRACLSAECNECEMHMARCGDEKRCNHNSRSADRSDSTKTKRVDGEDLPASSFLSSAMPSRLKAGLCPGSSRPRRRSSATCATRSLVSTRRRTFPPTRKPASGRNSFASAKSTASPSATRNRRPGVSRPSNASTRP